MNAVFALWRTLCAAMVLTVPATVEAQRDRAIPPELFGMHMNMGQIRSDYQWPIIPFYSWRLIHARTVWSSLESAPGTWQWEVLDWAVSDALAHRVQPLITLGHVPAWAARRKAGAPEPREGHGAFPPADLQAWRRYVTTVAERYRGKVHWYELWNEPHFSETDKPDFGFSADDMVALARVTREALRAVDPALRLVSFSPSGAERGVRRIELFLQRGGGAFVDAIGFHFYTSPPSPEAIPALAARLREAAVRHGVGGLPIWDTESGFMTEDPAHGLRAGPIDRIDRRVTEAEAADLVPRQLLMLLHAGVERHYHYGWAFKGFELAAESGRRANAAGQAWSTAHRWLAGQRFGGCRMAPPATWRCTLRRARDGVEAEVAWSAAGPVQMAVPAGWRHAETVAGVTRALPPGQALVLDGSPVLLKSDAAAWPASP
jgi:hypothetical protein